MNISQKIHHLISFGQDHLDAYAQRERESVECYALPENERDEYKRTHPISPKYYCGKAYRGSWLDKHSLLKITDKHAYDILEYYYEYLLIESYDIGVVDDYDTKEMWFKYNLMENKYFPIERPECFKNIFGFL